MKKVSEPRGHHFVPQFLLRAFARRISRKQHYVRVFHRDRAPHDANVEQFAKQRDFHRGSDLERAISSLETGFADVHRRLLSGAGWDDSQVERLVSHLLVRTKNLRDTFVAMGEAALEEFEAPSEGTRRYFRKELEAELAKGILGSHEWKALVTMLPASKRRELEAVIAARIDSAVDAEFPGAIAQLRKQLDLPALAEKAHLRGLTQSLSNLHPDARARLFSKIRWQVVALPDHALILGDMGPVCRFSHKQRWRHPMEESLPVTTIALPLAHNRLLVGDENPTSFSTEVADLNSSIAELSRDFFVASKLEDEFLLGLLTKVGTRSRYFGELTLDA